MVLRFSVAQESQSPLWDFGWFDLTRFDVGGPTAERDDCASLIDGFLRSPISQRSFCSPGPWGEPIQRHGPFVQAKLVAGWFLPVSPQELKRRVRQALDDPEFTSPPETIQRQPVEAWAESVEADGGTAFALEVPANADARLDWNVWLVYHEFVSISPDRRAMTVAVIGYD